MRVFLWQLGAFAVLQAGIAAILLSAYRVDETGYFAATIDKHALLDATPPGRILFVGGSNVTFGMDSPRVSEALGRPAINLSLHAALGLLFMLEEATAVARPGDVIVLSPEYEHFAGDITTDYLFNLLEQRPASSAYLCWRHVPVLLDTATAYFGRVLRRSIRCLLGGSPNVAESPYERGAFNREGDVVAHRQLPREPGGGRDTLYPRWHPGALDRVLDQLNAFDDAMRRRGVTVVYTFPPVSETALENIAPGVQQVYQALLDRCTIPVLDTPASASQPRTEFFDTAYHLNGEGTRRRVDRLIPLLRPRLR